MCLILLQQPSDPDERDFAEGLLRGHVTPQQLAIMKHEDMFCRKLKLARVRCLSRAVIAFICLI